ncbi:hypothetical protein OF83DRAFT_623630 [Amylostereum chailletii]|nr:hypothetical protein OF83DRAFT_623630 [Amylostereum chailletii]
MNFRHTMALPIPTFSASPSASGDIPVKAEEKCKPDLETTEKAQPMPEDEKTTVKASASPLMPKNDLTASDGLIAGCDPLTLDVSTKENDPTGKPKSRYSHDGLALASLPVTESSPRRRPIIMTRDVTGEVEIHVSEDRHHPYLIGHSVLVEFRLIG